MVKISLALDERVTEQIVEKIIGQFAFLIQRELIQRFPSSFKNRIEVAKEGTDWIIGSNYNILIYYDQGTKAHKIRAKLKKSLAFKWNKQVSIPGQPKGGKYLFKEINHPGTKPKHILRDLEKDKQILQKFLNMAIKNVLK